MYFSSEKTVSACARSRSRMTGCGSVTSASAASTISCAHAAGDRFGAHAGEPLGERRPSRLLTERQRDQQGISTSRSVPNPQARAMLRNTANGRDRPSSHCRRYPLVNDFQAVRGRSLGWVWLTLVQLVLVLIVAVLLAVTLNPVIDWLERHGWPRWAAAAVIFVGLLATLGGFGWVTWASVSGSGVVTRPPISRSSNTNCSIACRRGCAMRPACSVAKASQSSLALWALRFGRSAISAVVVGLLGLILTMYLVVEAQATTEWMLAFVPKAKRGRAEQTIVEAQRVIFALRRRQRADVGLRHGVRLSSC